MTITIRKIIVIINFIIYKFHFRRFIAKNYEIKLAASKQIQTFFRKYANFERMKDDLKKSSENWLKHNDPARVYGAIMIQRSWRGYKKNLLVRVNLVLYIFIISLTSSNRINQKWM